VQSSVNVSPGAQGTAISTRVELVCWLPNQSGPLLLKLGCSCFYLLYSRELEIAGPLVGGNLVRHAFGLASR
jgi:hypothetical protein